MPELTIGDALEYGIQAHRSGKLKEADKYYTAILKVKPDHSHANHNMGLLALQLGKLDQGLKFLRIALIEDPNVEQFWISLIDALIKAGNRSEAFEKYGEAMDFGVSSSKLERLKDLITPELDSSNEMGIIHPPDEEEINLLVSELNLKNYAYVIEKTRSLIDQFPNLPRLHNILGIAYAGSGDFLQAVEQYDKAIEISPNFERAYLNLGVAQKSLGRVDVAIKTYQKILKNNPNFAEVYNNLGNALRDIGEIENALVNYKNAITQRSNYADCIENIHSLAIQLITVDMDTENQLDNIFQSKVIQFETKPKLLMQRAIQTYIKGDNQTCLAMLKMFQSCSQAHISNLDFVDQKFCKAYYVFLSKLTKQLPVTRKASKYIFHFGESHCLSYANHHIELNGNDIKIHSSISFGTKVYHLSKEGKSLHKALLENKFYSIEKQSVVLISYGEIDCRYDEGFLSASKKLNVPLKYLITECVSNYVSFIKKLNIDCYHQIYFLNLAAPVFNPSIDIELNNRVRECVEIFNSELKKSVTNHEFEIIDMYNLTVAESGFSNNRYHVDNHHLGPNALHHIQAHLARKY